MDKENRGQDQGNMEGSQLTFRATEKQLFTLHEALFNTLFLLIAVGQSCAEIINKDKAQFGAMQALIQKGGGGEAISLREQCACSLICSVNKSFVTKKQ